MPKAILVLDLGGVLMRHDPDYEQRMSRLLKEPCSESYLSLMREYELGNITTADFLAQLHQWALPGVTTDQLIAAWNSIHAGIPEQYLQCLSKWQLQGYRLLLLSNNSELRWQHVLEQYDLRTIEHFFLSYQLHLLKPDAAIYAVVNNYISDHPAHICFVDDSPANREAAEVFGWQTFASIEELDRFLSR